MTVEHEPWIGRNYAKGIDGQRILIMGFSHYGGYSDGHDDDKFTKHVVKTWALTGEVPFFNHIAGYFGFEPGVEFWEQVAFANTIGSSVGTDIYSFGTTEQRDAVQQRVLRLLGCVRPPPHKAVVFSRKGWPLWPPFDATPSTMLKPENGYEIEYGGYCVGDGHEVLAFGLRHTQFASFERMHASVRAIVDLPPPGRFTRHLQP